MLEDEFDQRGKLFALGDAAVGPLKRLARSEGEELIIRQRAIYALGEIAAPSSVRALRSLLAAKEAVLRLFAVRALTKIQGEAAVDDLEPLLGDPDASVRKTALHALAQIGDERSLAALQRHEGEEQHPAIREVAKGAIAEIRRRPRR